TPDEVSIVSPTSLGIPAGTEKSEDGWRAFKVEGPLDFGLVGILASLTAPLKDAGVSVFCVSTFDTDWVLVKEGMVEKARE
ncbi:ACT domain-containing protein, partial [Blyttiomyces helicus]